MDAEFSDDALAAVWQAGDQRAGARLLRRYSPALERYFERSFGAGEGQDLRQEALLRVTRSIAGFRFESSFRTYVYRIARRTACDHLRRRGSARGRQQAALLRFEEDDGVAEIAADGEGLRDLLTALADLEAQERALVQMRCFEGLSFAEIAAATGANPSTSTMRARLHQIRRQLRARLEDR